jgi:hypothetical protein
MFRWFKRRCCTSDRSACLPGDTQSPPRRLGCRSRAITRVWTRFDRAAVGGPTDRAITGWARDASRLVFGTWRPRALGSLIPRALASLVADAQRRRQWHRRQLMLPAEAKSERWAIAYRCSASLEAQMQVRFSWSCSKVWGKGCTRSAHRSCLAESLSGNALHAGGYSGISTCLCGS